MRLLLFFLIFSFAQPSLAQVSDSIPTAEEHLVPLDFSEEKINNFKEDPAFDYSEAAEKDNWWTNFKRWIRLQWNRFLNWLFGDFEAPLLLAIFLDILPYLLLGLLLVFILYLFSRLDTGDYFFGKKRQGELIFDEEEKIIRSRDIKKLIAKAVEKENYRLAVRYHFLYVLQQLSRMEIVTYDNSKTDEDYLSEIKEAKLREHFKKISRIYDFVWYGNFATTAEDYDRIKIEFQKAEKLIEVEHEQKL